VRRRRTALVHGRDIMGRAACSSSSSQQPAHTKTSQSLREIEHSCFLERSQQQQEASQFCLYYSLCRAAAAAGRSAAAAAILAAAGTVLAGGPAANNSSVMSDAARQTVRDMGRMYIVQAHLRAAVGP
jgi:hypothetical protein